MDNEAVVRRISAAALLVLISCALPSGFAVAQPAISQQPTPYQPTLQKATPAVLERATKLLKEGKPQEALDALEGLEPVAPVLRLRVEAAAALGRTGLALDTYDRLERTLGKPDPDTLGVVAHAVLDEIGRSGDPLLTIESCRAEVAVGRTSCAKSLAKVADDSTTPMTVQAQALSVLVNAGDTRARDRLKALAASARGQDRRAAIDAARYLPSDDAARILGDALKSDQADLQYAAASALGELTPPTPTARETLQHFLGGKPTSPGRVAAELSLASMGDAGMLKGFSDQLETLGTGELLQVGSVLATRGDPRGVAALERVVASDNELLRIRAAAHLASARPDLARGAMKTALASDNPWVRASALEHFATTPLLDMSTSRRALADPDPWVRLRAASAVLERLARGITDTPPAPAKPASATGRQGM